MRASQTVTGTLVSLIAVAATTGIMIWIDARISCPGLLVGYLLPITVSAVYFGAGPAIICAAASAAAATYFLLPPKLAFSIDTPRHVAELGFFMLVAVIGAKIAALLSPIRTLRGTPPAAPNISELAGKR